ncbi:MAG TPA: hypothetical protein VFM21_01340 [Terriglobia bacterium]|nr:hypothetical protein [Terriglobia bacterium]
MAKIKMRKLTVLVPEDLVRRAQRSTRSGITPTVRHGLELAAKESVYEEMLRLKGKGGFSMTWQELRGEE